MTERNVEFIFYYPFYETRNSSKSTDRSEDPSWSRIDSERNDLYTNPLGNSFQALDSNVAVCHCWATSSSRALGSRNFNERHRSLDSALKRHWLKVEPAYAAGPQIVIRGEGSVGSVEVSKVEN